jgi:hypothetical protein
MEVCQMSGVRREAGSDGRDTTDRDRWREYVLQNGFFGSVSRRKPVSQTLQGKNKALS